MLEVNQTDKSQLNEHSICKPASSQGINFLATGLRYPRISTGSKKGCSLQLYFLRYV